LVLFLLLVKFLPFSLKAEANINAG